jgi:hypothetical protein
MDRDSRWHLKAVLLFCVLRHQERHGGDLQQSYDICESLAEPIFGSRLFVSFGAFKMFKHRFGDGFVTRFGESDPDSPETPEPVPIYRGVMYGMHTIERDKSRPRSCRINENDRVAQDEEDLFLRAVVQILNNPPKRNRKWTLQEIRAECAGRRAKGAEEFQQELQSVSQVK